MEERKMFPVNLQFFAEEGGDNSETAPESNPPENPSEKQKNEQGNGTPDIKELMAQVQTLNDQLQTTLVDNAKQKRTIDKLTKELGDTTKKYRATLSEQEQASLAKAEAEAARQAEFDDMKRRLAINDLVSEYMDRDFPKDVATKIATARYDGDNDTVNTIEKQMDEAKRKQWEAEFLKNRPEINAGTGNAPTITKEQFDNMTLIEKTKLKRENEAEYNRLLAL